jgi:hypothetical protein
MKLLSVALPGLVSIGILQNIEKVIARAAIIMK